MIRSTFAASIPHNVFVLLALVTELASDSGSGSDACHGSIVSHFNIPGPALKTRSCELKVFVLNKIFMFQNDILINCCSKNLLKLLFIHIKS